MKKLIIRELIRISLILFLPIYLPIWMLYAGNNWIVFGFYFKTIFSKDLLIEKV